MRTTILAKVKFPFFCILIILLYSCQDFLEEDDIFKQPASQRSEAAISTYQQTLSDGGAWWRLLYEGIDNSDSTIGKFDFYMKFSADGSVTMISDLNINPTFKNSYYTIRMQQAPVLTFTTYNDIHDLVNPSYGIKGKGIGGDFSFILKSVSSEKTTITMTELTRSAHSTVKLVKSQLSRDEILTLIEAKVKIETRLKTSSNPIHSNISLVDEFDDFIASVTYDSIFRRMSLTFYTEQGILDTTISSGVYLNSNALVLRNQGVSSVGVNTKFTWNSATNIFEDIDGNKIAYVLYKNSIPLASHVKNYNDALSLAERENDLHVKYRLDHSRIPDPRDRSSAAFNKIATDAEITRVYLHNPIIRDATYASNIRVYFKNGGSTTYLYKFNIDELQDKGRVKFVKDGELYSYNSTTKVRVRDLDPTDVKVIAMNKIATFLFDSEGFFVRHMGRLNNYSNETYEFRSFTYPEYYLVGYGSSSY